MTTRKIALSALGAALVLSTAATASFAAPGKGHKDRMPIRQEAAFVHLLKVADTNKDGKISKEEFTARQDALFAEIDKDKDGSIDLGVLAIDHLPTPEIGNPKQRLSLLTLHVVSKMLTSVYVWPYMKTMAEALRFRARQIR